MINYLWKVLSIFIINFNTITLLSYSSTKHISGTKIINSSKSDEFDSTSISLGLKYLLLSKLFWDLLNTQIETVIHITIKSEFECNRKMKIFQISQQNLAYLGFSYYYTIQMYPINVRNITALSVLITITSMACMYLYREAKTFQEYADGAYACSTLLDTTAIFTIFVWRMRIFFDCFNRFEKILNQSEIFYLKLNFNIQIHSNDVRINFQGLNMPHQRNYTGELIY